MTVDRNILKSDRIELARIEEKHLQKRVAFLNDPVVQRTLTFDYPTSLCKTKKWFDKILMDRTRVDFSIMENETDKMIGFCGLIDIDFHVKKAELYIVIGDKDYWGGGYGSEGNKLLTNYGFIELGLNKVYGYQLAMNEKGHKHIKKLGKKIDGILRNDIFAHGEIHDLYVTSILRSEWEDNKIYNI